MTGGSPSCRRATVFLSHVADGCHGKVASGAQITLDEMKRGSGRISSFSTLDPDEVDGDGGGAKREQSPNDPLPATQSGHSPPEECAELRLLFRATSMGVFLHVNEAS